MKRKNKSVFWIILTFVLILLFTIFGVLNGSGQTPLEIEALDTPLPTETYTPEPIVEDEVEDIEIVIEENEPAEIEEEEEVLEEEVISEPIPADFSENIEEEVLIEEIPEIDNVPTEEETSETEVPIEETLEVEETPIIEEIPVVEETPTIEEIPVVEETSTIEEIPTIEETSVEEFSIEETPIPTSTEEITPTITLTETVIPTPTETVTPKPEKRVRIFTNRKSVVELGEPITLTSELINFEDVIDTVTYQWECRKKGAEDFENVEGANGSEYIYYADAENLTWDWRLTVYYDDGEEE